MCRLPVLLLVCCPCDFYATSAFSKRLSHGSRAGIVREAGARIWAIRPLNGPVLVERQLETPPNVNESVRQSVDEVVVVVWARRYAQTFPAFRHGRIIDRLDVDA